jgi:hypothetical protein
MASRIIAPGLLVLIVVGALACTGPAPPRPHRATLSVRGTVRVPSEGPRPTELSFLDESGRHIATARITIKDASPCRTPSLPADPRESDPPDIELPRMPPANCNTVVGSFTIDLPEAASYVAIIEGITADPQVISADELRASGYVWVIEVPRKVAL